MSASRSCWYWLWMKRFSVPAFLKTHGNPIPNFFTRRVTALQAPEVRRW